MPTNIPTINRSYNNFLDAAPPPNHGMNPLMVTKRDVKRKEERNKKTQPTHADPSTTIT